MSQERTNVPGPDPGALILGKGSVGVVPGEDAEDKDGTEINNLSTLLLEKPRK